MEDNPIKEVTKSIKQPDLLCSLSFENTKKPLGGLNRNSPSFNLIGQQYKSLLIQHANLNRNSNVLDIGSGTGRLIGPLLEIIDKNNYIGFDVCKRYVDISKEHHPNIIVDHFDVHHEEFNPSGSINPLEFKFPYPDRHFDLIICLGVFNHFRQKWVSNYIRETSRVIKPKGIFFSTFLLLNQPSLSMIESGKTQRPFVFSVKNPDGWSQSSDRPLLNVALPEIPIRRTFIKSGFMIREPIRYGQWCGSELALTGHDVIIAKKGHG